MIRAFIEKVAGRRPATASVQKNMRTRGKSGEEEAVRHLESNGYRIIETNYSIRAGEIDIVAMKNGILSFVEVKLRNTGGYGSAEASVNLKKQRRITLAAKHFILKRKVGNMPMRFDVVTVDGTRPGPERVTMIENAFDAAE